MTDKDDIPELETPTECEDEEKEFELRVTCASEVRLNNEGHEDHDDDVEPPMSTDKVEVEYEFHNNTTFVQVEFGLEDEDVEETEGLSQIRPTLQALNSPNMWIGDTGATRHSTKYKQGESTRDHLHAEPEESPGKQSNQVWKLIFQGCIVTKPVMTSLQ